MINHNATNLQKNIETALEHAKLTVTVGQDTSNGAPPFTKQEYPLIADITKVATRVAKFDAVMPQPEMAEPYSLVMTDAMRKIIEAIVKETISYIVVNAELAAKQRYDALDSDYNALLTSIDSLAAVFLVKSRDLTNINPYVTYIEMAEALAALSVGGNGPGIDRSDRSAEFINTNEEWTDSKGTVKPMDIK